MTAVVPPAPRIAPATWSDVVAVVDACSPGSLAARFLGAVAPPRSAVLARLARTHREGWTLVAAAPGPVGLLGVHPDGDGRAELGALVADAHQGRAVGAALVDAVLRAPCWRDRALHAVVGHGNHAAHGLVRVAARQVTVTRHRFADGVEYVLHPRELR
ncbi:GNAT family N-acetyltransferase [Pseudonocardia kujensis]|uniref:GNAT family N-acetyltransferase n=1 Tax=Pseudonocardia kujensis TaxID=1128675 RepID=UPI001E41FCBA|nr:GNAT family N-acetyltransferase [Pseudonocardia kujensis]MCE0763427.1 GNAT family N-acetyltransferase [Pseudonocardia kujensis]